MESDRRWFTHSYNDPEMLKVAFSTQPRALLPGPASQLAYDMETHVLGLNVPAMLPSSMACEFPASPARLVVHLVVAPAGMMSGGGGAGRGTAGGLPAPRHSPC